MLFDLLDSILRPAAYRRFAAEPRRRVTGYVAFLAAVYVVAFGFALELRIVPEVNATFAWLETSMPTLRFTGGKVVADPPAAVRLEHPRYKEVALEIDTARQDPVTPKILEDLKVNAYLTSNALYYANGGRLDSLDLSKAGLERPEVLDARSYRELERAFDWSFYPGLLLAMYLLFAAWLTVFGLLYALVGMVMASFAGRSLPFGALLRVALHAQSAGALLYALDAILPFSIPGVVLISCALSLVYLQLGVRSASVPAGT